MDKGEQLALIQRVERASGSQAKEALESMILKCGTKHSTIARAIRDAIQRYTPAPTIVYENPEPNDDSDASLAPSPMVRRNKRKDESDGRRADEAALSETSDHDTGGLRRHAKASLKTKTATTGKENVSGHRNHQQNNPNSSKKRTKRKEARHAPTRAPGTEHRTVQRLVGRPSKQAKTHVADLVTSSNLEISEQDRLLGQNLKHDVSDVDLAIFISSEDEPWYAAEPHKHTASNRIPNNQRLKIGNSEADISITDSSDDESSIDERQGNALAVAAGPPLASSNVKTTQAGAANSDGGVHAQSFTIPIREASNLFGAGKPSSVLSSKKRKAQDLVAEKTEPAKAANDIHAAKKPKQDHPQDQQNSPKDWKCRICYSLFPSVAQLLEHHKLHREDVIATDGHHHNSEVPACDLSRQSEEVPKSTNKVGDSSMGNVCSTMQPSSRLCQKGPAEQGLPEPPPSFEQKLTSTARGPSSVPTAMTSLVPERRSLMHGFVDRSAPLPFSKTSASEQPRTPTAEVFRHDYARIPDDEIIQECMYCEKRYRYSENVPGVCVWHPGRYRLLTEAQIKSHRRKEDRSPITRYIGWSCCSRKEWRAAACRGARHVAKRASSRQPRETC